MADDQNKNIIDFSAARKRQRTTKRFSPPGWGNQKKPSSSRQSAFANLARWILFLGFLGLTSYILQQCGMM